MVIVLVISIAIIGLCIGIGTHIHNKLIREGQIIERKTDFVRYGSQFTSRVGALQAVSGAVRSFDYRTIGAQMRETVPGQVFDFSGSGYSAVMRCVGFDASSGIGRYQFQFTAYKTDGSIPKNALSMNKLLTRIEKMFLAFDAETGVQNYEVNFKTKHSFI